MKLTLKKRVLNGLNLGGYFTKLNGRTYNITKNRAGGWDVYGCAMGDELNGFQVATGCKSLGWAETAVIESVGRVDRATTWISGE